MTFLIKKILIPLAFALNTGLTVFGFAALLDSPYTGIRTSVCGDIACVNVDKGSTAFGKVGAGDRLVDVAGLNVSSLAFNPTRITYDLARINAPFGKPSVNFQKLS